MNKILSYKYMKERARVITANIRKPTQTKANQRKPTQTAKNNTNLPKQNQSKHTKTNSNLTQTYQN